MSQSFIHWPAPAGEVASPDYTLEVDGQPVFVHQARVRCEVLQTPGLWTHKPDCPAQRASFAVLDLRQPVTVVVRPARACRLATVLPHRAGIEADVTNGGIRLRVDRPRHLTVLPDDDDARALHLFLGEPETDAPRPDGPGVIYFPPGLHEVETIRPVSGQTVYLAGGAVVRAKLARGETGTYSEQWKVRFYGGRVIDLQGVENVRICGRGILDGGLVPHPGRNMVCIDASHDVRLGGIVLRDAPNWNVLIGQSRNVEVDDLRIISGRLNSDGINSVGSQDVRVRRCFVRNHDDSIVVKTTQPDFPAQGIAVDECSVWNDWGFGLGVTYETRSPIRDVHFSHCDIHYARHWCAGVRVSDSATVSEVSFRDIEVADPWGGSPLQGAHAALTHEPVFLRLDVVKDCWGKDPNRGRIRDVSVEGAVFHGRRILASELAGFDAEHDIRGVRFRNIRLAGQPPARNPTDLHLQCNEYVRDVVVEA